MQHPALTVSDDIGRALCALFDAQRSLMGIIAAPRPHDEKDWIQGSDDDPFVTLTDEENPVRIAGEDAFLELSFSAAAKLFIQLGRISQVTELVEELTHG